MTAREVSRRVQALLRSTPAIRDPAMRRRAMRSYLESWSAEELVTVAEQLIPLAVRGDEDARVTAFALSLAMIDARYGEAADLLGRARSVAIDRGAELVALWLSEAAPRKQLAKRGRLHEVGMAANSGLPPSSLCMTFIYEEPFGEDRREVHRLSREQIRRYYKIDRGLKHHDSFFVRRLLSQRWISEREVVVIASRRPTTEAILLELIKSDRWMVSPPVIRAIINNPFTPPSIRNPLLVAAPIGALEELASMGHAGDETAALAAQFLALRAA